MPVKLRLASIVPTKPLVFMQPFAAFFPSDGCNPTGRRSSVVGQFDCHPEQAFLRSEEPVPSEVEGIWANRAMCRVLCHTIIACLARFLF
jgi:hypothetical protein